MNSKLIPLACIGLVLMNSMTVVATEGEPINYAAMEKQESNEFDAISGAYPVMSEGVSVHYYNTYIEGVRAGDKNVITSTDENGQCIGRVDDNKPDNTQYKCVVLPYEWSDEYNRGDIVYVRYDDAQDDVDAVIPCIVIDFKQENHAQTINFVGEFNYHEGDVAWLVEEK